MGVLKYAHIQNDILKLRSCEKAFWKPELQYKFTSLFQSLKGRYAWFLSNKLNKIKHQVEFYVQTQNFHTKIAEICFQVSTDLHYFLGKIHYWSRHLGTLTKLSNKALDANYNDGSSRTSFNLTQLFFVTELKKTALRSKNKLYQKHSVFF